MEKQYVFYIKGSVPKGHPFPIVSWLIRLLEWSDISHVFFEFPEEQKVFHAYFNDIKWQDKEEYYKSIEERYSFPVQVNEPVYRAILSHLNAIKGMKKGYFLQLIGVFIAILFRRLFGLHIKNPLHFFSSKTCTQVVAETMRLHIDSFESWARGLGPHEENMTTQDIVAYGKKFIK